MRSERDHQLPQREQRPALRRVIALVLSASAGFIVAVGFMSLRGVELGAMTGNTVAAGTELGAHGTAAVLTRLVPIPAFVVGVGAGVAGIEALGRRGRVPALGAVLAVETILLAAFIVGGRAALVGTNVEPRSIAALDLLVALPALALGLQTAALRRVGGRTVRTTFMTGMLTRFAEEGSVWLFDRRDRDKNAPRTHWPHHPDGSHVLFLGGLWSVYLGGAVTGAFLETRIQLDALVVPLIALVVLVAVDCASPVYGHDSTGGVTERGDASRRPPT